MDSRHLTKHQCDWLNVKLSGMARELYLIHKRMLEREFPQNDKLRYLISDAYEAVFVARQHAHSLCCQGQMGDMAFFVDQDGNGTATPQHHSQTAEANSPTSPHDQAERDGKPPIHGVSRLGTIAIVSPGTF